MAAVVMRTIFSPKSNALNIVKQKLQKLSIETRLTACISLE
ncbi:hypothetical protein B4U79_13282 [Dinothrombium tinctorium]|uniref:Uncharacterized protein n=1 Tax=Dinothrombium tinctorium TaxID=1965070 RepID=A0A3S3PJ28_9ACAR|nr:hypothetical protein B4U79_13282 [Dinothrombium tinctorium]